MDNLMKDLHELCETISRAIMQANEKIRVAGGKVTSADMEYIDRLTHSLKSVKAVMAMIEDSDDDYSERGYSRRGYSREGSYRGYPRGRSYDDGSYARGRYARRDSMGRYSRDGDMIEQLRDAMEMASDDQTRQELQRMIEKIEQR